MSEEQSLKDKTAKGLFWGGFSNGIQQLLNLVFGIFIARLLTPSDYGMAGNEMKAVKRNILRNTRCCRSVSSDIFASTGCATPFIMPSMNCCPMPHHLLDWL